MDSKSCVENVQQAQSRIQTLQENWPTGDVVRPDAVDWNERTKEIIRSIIRSKLFLFATIVMTIAAVPSLALIPIAIGLWLMISKSKNGDQGLTLGFKVLMIGQYINFGLGVFVAMANFVIMVQSCTDTGRQFVELQEVLFWGTAVSLGFMFLMVALRWKIVTAVKTIKEAYEETNNNGIISVSSIVVCFVVGVTYCLSAVGIIYGIATILFGVVLAKYRKEMIKLDEEKQDHKMTKVVRQVIEPTWKKIEEGQV